MAATFRYRVAYYKLKEAAFLSHLDTFRLFDRALRRTRLAVAFTRGFNPRVKMAALQALPVGLGVESESLAVTLQQEYPAAEVSAALARELPAGLGVRQVEQWRGWPEPPEELRFEIRCLGTQPAVQTAARLWSGRPAILVDRAWKGRVTQVDLKPFVADVECAGNRITVRIAPAKGALPRPGDLMAGFRRIPEGVEPAVRISEIVRL